MCLAATAKVLTFSEGMESASAVLVSGHIGRAACLSKFVGVFQGKDKDSYMITPCRGPTWFVVQVGAGTFPNLLAWGCFVCRMWVYVCAQLSEEIFIDHIKLCVMEQYTGTVKVDQPLRFPSCCWLSACQCRLFVLPELPVARKREPPYYDLEVAWSDSKRRFSRVRAP